jgi:FHS family L-fucose permease-like MFS transporter
MLESEGNLKMQISSSREVSRNTDEPAQSIFPGGGITLFVLVTVLFFLWGMSNNLTDILVQQFRKSFELSQFGAQLVQTANFLGYFCMAIPAALVMQRWGYKSGMVLGLTFFGGGMILFWPAALSGQYVPFLIALFAVGCGASMLETAANPFIAQFGSANTSERRLNFAQSFNPPGTILGVVLGARFIFSGIEKKPAEVAAMKAAGTYTGYLHAELMRVVPTYLVLGTTVLLFGVLLLCMKFPTMSGEGVTATKDQGSFRALLHYPHLWFAVFANFCNVGAQVSTWSSLIPYMKQYTTVTERVAAGYLTATLVALMVGRFLTTPLMKYVSPSRMLGFYGAANVVLIGIAITHPSIIGAYAIVASSFFLSIMFPTIFALGLKGLGPNTKLAGSFLVMAIVGGAIFPPILGWIAKATGSLAYGYIVPAIGFLGVSLYGFMTRQIQPPPGNTSPDAGPIIAERGYGL